MTAATSSLNASAHNIANQGTGGFRRQLAQHETVASGGVMFRSATALGPGNAWEADTVGLLIAKNSFLANMELFRATDRMSGSLLNTFA
jgi:flagellar hook protein FlgE